MAVARSVSDWVKATSSTRSGHRPFGVHRVSSCPGVRFNFIDFIGFFPPSLAGFCLDSCALLASLCSHPIQAGKGRDPICYQLLDAFALTASNWAHWRGGKTYLGCCHNWIKGPPEPLPHTVSYIMLWNASCHSEVYIAYITVTLVWVESSESLLVCFTSIHLLSWMLISLLTRRQLNLEA